MPDLAASNKKSVIRVLHVDDDSSIFEVSKQILMDMDGKFEFDHACCVDDAFKKLSAGQYDIIISDYDMPQKNGLQFLKELREQKNELPFVLFTGKGREEVAIKALNLGADGYFTKQGSPETVYGELYHGIRMAVTRKTNEVALFKAQVLMNSIFNSTKDMIWAVSADDFRLLTFNKPMSDYFFRTQKLSVKEGMGLKEIMPTEQLVDKWLELNRRALKEGSFTIEYKTLKEPRVLELTFDLLKRGEEVFGIAVFGKDITERKKIEETVRKSEARYRELANFLPEIVFEADLTGRITFFNQRAFEVTGFSQEELEKGVNMLSFVVPEERERARVNVGKALSGGALEGHEYALYKKNGIAYPAIVKTTAIISENEVTGLRGLVIDLTELRNVEEALGKSEERFRQLVLSSPDTIHLLDPISHKVEFLNRNEFLGYSRAELEGANSIVPWLHPDDCELVQTYHQLVLNGSLDGQRPVEYRLKSKTGSWEWVRSRATILKYDEKGKPEQILVTLTLITENKKVEVSLKESEEKFKKLAEESPNIIFINKQGRVVYANKKCEEITGYSREEFYSPNFNFLSLNPPECVEAVTLAYAKHMRGEPVPPYEYVLITRDGKRINALINTTLIEYDGDKAILGIVTDITERKKTEEVLRQERDMLESVAKASGAGLVIVSKDYRVLWANDFIKRYKGDTIGKLCYATLNSLDAPCPDCGVAKIFAGKTPLDSHEYFSNTVDGAPYCVEIVATPLADETGNITSAVEICVDITERKKNEEKLRESIRKNELMKEKLHVVGGLSRHDVRNKLSAMNGYAYLLKKKHSDQPDIVDGLVKIEQGVKEIGRIFDFTKMYEQLGAEDPSLISVEKTIAEAIILFSGSPKVEVINECQGLTVRADSFLRQLYYNLIDNSIKHGKKVTKIRVHWEKADHDSLNLIYEDDGIGVPVQNKPHLFKEGFSTAGSSGYGLYLIRKMMDVYGWTIQENGEPGKGVKFVITIPRFNSSGKENFQIT